MATPLVNFFGYTNPGESVEWYKQQVTSLADAIAQKHAVDSDSRASGLIVNTGAWSDQAGGSMGTELLHHAIEAFEIDIVLVIGHDRLYASLQDWSNTRHAAVREKDADNWRQQARKNLIVAKLPRSGGVVARTEVSRRRARRARVHEYFYGKKRIVAGEEQPPRFRPHRLELSLSSCTFLSNGGVRLSESMRPLGQETSGTQGGGTSGGLQPVPPSSDLEHAVLAVLQAPDDGSSDGQRVPSNIAGFVYVVKLELDLNTVTVLSPCPGKLPSLDFVVGSIKWVE